MYLVIGATAHFGRQTVEELVAANAPVRALTRTPERAGLPAQAEVVRGDLTKPETLPSALAGVETVFLVPQYGLDFAPLLEAAAQAGVRRLVLLSSGAVVPGAERQPDVIAQYHRDVERAVEASGIEWTFLRLLFPAINSLTFAMQLQGGDVIRAPYMEAAFSAVHERDVAEVAARILVDGGHAGQAYDLTGPESLTQAQQVRILSETLERPLTVEDVDPEPVLQQMSRFMDHEFLAALFGLMAQAVGKPAPVNDVIEQVTGHPARTYAQWAADHRTDFTT
ncbi:NAD-dependent epimerase/dehydratase family protein [Nonomuraea mesophila]|uniref:NAD-dependent epimerase/dehydratase family protein n=1 Tax=Nonomuraea mesophila TaxID=2530382 RepID=A0A4R5FWJ5_9ACTN|nr:NAD(P)H-binding protein [Nonomuraea mesophila]TDE59446.1 NAD-dependent epimerase/dehydratase family protein [Nonomuraea mesophila]